MKITKTLFFTLTLLNITNASPTGEELTKTKCATCHMLEVPKPNTISTLKAPPLHAVLFHIKSEIENPIEQKKFIMDYVINPKASKSVCESNKVKNFGVMPSQKGKVTQEELSLISDYVIKTFPTPKFVQMITSMHKNGKMHGLKNSPFLMNQEALPHLTKILLQNWDKAKLALTNEQKAKLLVVRKETMKGVKKIKKALKPLETEVIDMIVDGEDLTKIQPKVDEVAKLKAQATMIHLKCLKDSIEVLTDKQMEYILPFWDA